MSSAPRRPPRSPNGPALGRHKPVFRAPEAPTAAVRLLPSGDAYCLLHGADRGLLVPDAAQRAALWTPRVWPGAVLVGGEIVGTWRRAQANLAIEPWRRLSSAERDAVQAEAASLPLPGIEGQVVARWED